MSQVAEGKKPRPAGAMAYLGGLDHFVIQHEYRPRGDQPSAIDQLVRGVLDGRHDQVLLGVTGSGKTYAIACVVERLQRPTLVLAHNKTLAAQLCAELRDYFPGNAVEYFVSYYDYYQPEAYIPQSDLYIEKDADVNDEIDRLRHSATHSLLARRDVIVVASVSCIYGIGAPGEYSEMALRIQVGDYTDRDDLLRQLVNIQYTRSEVLGRGRFRARGDVVEVYPADAEVVIRVELFGDEVDKITVIDPLVGEVLGTPNSVIVVPASHYVVGDDRVAEACSAIEAELKERVGFFESQGRLLEAQRIQQRTRYDLEMMREIGSCKGIENYSRHLDGRAPGQPPSSLLDYFPTDWLVVIDECHQTIPQVRGMWHGDRSRKECLIEHGFRLPSALDNRPLTFEEFADKIPATIYVSATPAPYELEKCGDAVAEMIVRPTGLLDPQVEVRPMKGQIDDLIGEIRECVARGQRVLVLTLTKRMAEDLTSYLDELGVRVRYIHSEVRTLERGETIRDLRKGEFDVLVGINLLREGLDLPEVALVAVLDADAVGFLRSAMSLIQIMGRAARNVDGRVVLYADRMTDAITAALDETQRRRVIQEQHNIAHGITPQTVQKAVQDTIRARVQMTTEARELVEDVLGPAMRADMEAIIEDLEQQMRGHAERLEFEEAARVRDEVTRLRALRRR